MTETAIVSRAVPWLAHTAALARSLSQATAWCWLDGSADAAALQDDAVHCSYFAVADAVHTATKGKEHEFLDLLHTELVAERANPPSPVHAREAGLAGAPPESAMPAQFRGGWVTALSYEFGVALLGTPPAGDAADPAFALRVTEVLELNHRTGRATLHGRSTAALDQWWAVHGAAWNAEDRTGTGTGTGADADAEAGASAGMASATDVDPDPAAVITQPRWRRTAPEYEAQVAECQKSIVAGDAYVLCLTDCATTHTHTSPLDLYLRLRGTRPSVRGAVIVAGERALISASPERFLSLHANTLRTHPIKGTRPRAVTPEADAALAAELAADPKERAENLMIVDLMRNDLSRVCTPGTVHTEGFLRVESHPHVHQLVSTVTGSLRPEVTLTDVLGACFPGGSMTGAPKRSAVDILARVESAPRGLYAGCFGWIGAGAAGLEMEIAMTIRSIELRGVGTKTVTAMVGAGGGITADSLPDREEAERILKAQPVLAAIGH